jgi:hypothetical protein
MMKLTPSNHSDRHYLLPLPPGLSEDAPELFGFWTYEVRAGHDRNPVTKEPVWSTAQARFGRPLRTTGVQHPAPRLSCLPLRATFDEIDQDGIVVTAPFASPVLNGARLTSLNGGSRTQMWFMLYAQVRRADAAQMLNVLVGKTRGGLAPQDQAARDLSAMGRFLKAEIERRLRELALPIDAPLSVLAVELLPGGDPGKIIDPLGRQLGDQRILRTSPLVPVEATCQALARPGG